MNPFEDCHHTRHAVAGSTELTLGKSHELVRWTEAAGQQERKDVVGEVRPQMLLTGRWQKLTQIVLNHCLIENCHFARERGAYAAVPAGRLVGPQLDRGAERPVIPK
jgi:hypothetical protein